MSAGRSHESVTIRRPVSAANRNFGRWRQPFRLGRVIPSCKSPMPPIPRLFPAVMLLLFSSVVSAEESSSADSLPKLADAVETFRAALNAWSPQRFGEAVRLLEKIDDRRLDAEQVAQVRYWQAASRFHQVLAIRSGDEGAEVDLVAAAETLNAALEADDSCAECYVMRGVINGMRIARRPAAALWLGRKVLGDQRQALRLGKTNPRVRYLNGTSIDRASEGRESDKALAELLEAQRLFEQEAQKPAEPLEPRWGHDHCLYFIGELYRERGGVAKAVEFYRKALAINPRFQRAQHALGPLSRE